MTELEIAAAGWKRQVETADLLKHPSFWVGHYHNEELLGSIYAHSVSNEANLVMILGSPFAVTDEVTDTFIFLDRPGHVLVSHLAVQGAGVHTTDYRLNYAFDGRVTFEVPVKEWHPSERIRQACDHLASHRNKGRVYPFLEAFTTAAKWGELHETT